MRRRFYPADARRRFRKGALFTSKSAPVRARDQARFGAGRCAVAVRRTVFESVRARAADPCARVLGHGRSTWFRV